jgi:hypothetical protein
MNLLLGFEIPSGRRVEIPVNHTVVLGQTQVSGKTTTLEAMVERSGLKAIAFITKPGEKSFVLQSKVAPFFSESTLTDYWRYVVSIVENLMNVKLGWQERGWIVKLCQDYEDKTKAHAYKWKRPKSLRDLLANVEIVLPHLRSGTSEMICMQLKEYLEGVVREIGETEFSSKLDLQPGINVMDITDLSDGLKVLVIRSVIEFVHKHGHKIIVIIPEAWKFIPEGRSTPVKLALEGLIREGAAVNNFVWMDSQDLRGVDKKLLRSVVVWLFGVQRQKNEVSSTLASIPDYPKPTATQIMQLDKGQFYACFGTTLALTYVQPIWMSSDVHARAIAMGQESVSNAGQILKRFKADMKPPQMLQILDQESPEGENDAEIDTENHTGTDGGIQQDAGTPVRTGDATELPGVRDDQEDSLAIRDIGEGGRTIRPEASESRDPADAGAGGMSEAMWQEKYETLEAEYKTLIETHDAMADRIKALESYLGPDRMDIITKLADQKNSPAGMTPEKAGLPDANRGTAAENGAKTPFSAPELHGAPIAGLSKTQEEIYRYIIKRAENDPGILQVLTSRPELRVTVQRTVIEADSSTLRGALAVLISKKFFNTPQNGNAAFNELKRLGRSVAKPNVYRELDKLAELGFVTKEDAGYQAVESMKIQIVEQK